MRQRRMNVKIQFELDGVRWPVFVFRLFECVELTVVGIHRISRHWLGKVDYAPVATDAHPIVIFATQLNVYYSHVHAIIVVQLRVFCVWPLQCCFVYILDLVDIYVIYYTVMGSLHVKKRKDFYT
jgi:hypothetical protein